jgi:hypothetical protein
LCRPGETFPPASAHALNAGAATLPLNAFHYYKGRVTAAEQIEGKGSEA